MRNHLFLCIGLLCALWGATTAFGNEPMAGDTPAFATSTDVKLSTIRNLIEAKEYETAEKLALEVTSDRPDVVDGWMMLGYTRTLNDKFEESNIAYDAALERGAEPQRVYTLKAYNCRRLGDAEATRDCYRAILEADASNLETLMEFGGFEIASGNYDSAVQCFSEVLNAEPDNLEAVLALARIEDKRGNTPQVKFWLEKGLSHHPDDAALLKKISLVYLNEQRYSLSIHYLGKLLEADPGNMAAYRNLGIAHYQQGNKKKAKNAFEKVREGGDKMNGLYGPLADCYRSIGQPARALEVIREGLAAAEQEAWLYSIWGKILEDRKEYDLAIAKFDKAVALRDEPWSGYARKQIARQTQLKKREAMMAAQGSMQ